MTRLVVPDAIHHTDTSESLEYIKGWNDCRQVMLAEQPAPAPGYCKHCKDYTVDAPMAEQSAQQEPVAWWDAKLGVFDEKHFDQLQPLYTSPQAQPAREPLTNLEGLKLAYNHHWLNNRAGVDAYLLGIRDAEAAHGIKENQS